MNKIRRDIEDELKRLKSLVRERKYKPVPALEEMLGLYKSLVEAAIGSNPEPVSDALGDLRRWFNEGRAILVGWKNNEERQAKLNEEFQIVKGLPETSDLDEIQRRRSRVKSIMEGLSECSQIYNELEPRYQHFNQSYARIQELGGSLCDLLRKAEEAQRKVKWTRIKILLLGILFLLASLGGAILAGWIASFLWLAIVGNPFPSWASVIVGVLAFALENAIFDTFVSGLKEKWSWELYEGVLQQIEKNVGSVYQILTELESIPETTLHKS